MRPGRWDAAAGIAAGLIAAAAAAPSFAAAPPGATARCADGSYSFSQHRSGTCSHHGGVADWLGPAAPPVGVAIGLGRTVLLQRRVATAGCVPAARPDRRCSPGAYDSGLTKAVICSSSFRTSSVRHVSEATKHAVLREYGMPIRSYGSALEIDHIVSLELGGSNDIANLFPERAAAPNGYHQKDRLENVLHSLVCANRIALRTAQRAIASNWVALYRRLLASR